ncbi:hypothetical protein CRE_24936 [Caenorhabditis remanei]|uniref:Uncharacterized protein n=1 Tax=Caenorhabditis remanei TaxID=31234 RepID=E3MHV0_CAERE|nr:hypothetical protein CRE_24936 [Caenorhabditis remanei]
MDAIALHYLNVKTTVDWSCNPPRPLDPDTRPTFYLPTEPNIAQISQLDHGGVLRTSSLNSACSRVRPPLLRILPVNPDHSIINLRLTTFLYETFLRSYR